MRNQAQGLHKRSCTLRKLVNTQIKGITLIYTGKIIFVPVAFLMALSICGFLWLVTFQLGTKMQKCNRMAITIFKILF